MKENTKESKENKATNNWKAEWEKIRKGLKNKKALDDETKNEWEKAINIFSERLDKFYISPIKELIDLPEKYGGQGFVIVTAQCALIETFAAFKNGKIYDENKEESEIYYYKSGKLFQEFLKSEDLFQKNFGGNDKPSVSDFYKSVRCGLLHETRTKVKWTIKADVKKYLKNDIITEKTFAAKTSGKYIVFRNQLQDALQDYFDTYKKKLANPAEKFNELRQFLARKLDHLFDIDKDETFDWWKHQCICKHCNQIKTN
jgi:hypothetical protein